MIKSLLSPIPGIVFAGIVLIVGLAITSNPTEHSSAIGKLDVQPLNTLRTTNLVVDNTAVVTGRLSEQLFAYTPASAIGGLPFETILNDWAPTGLQTNSVLSVKASDNTGSLITGVDSTGVSVGDIRYICNFNAPTDDGVVALSNQDSRSLANNQIVTPDSGRLTSGALDEFYIANESCVPIIYAQPDIAAPTTKKWVVTAPGRAARQISQLFQLFPPMQPDQSAITGTLNNWNPTDTCPQISGPHGYSTTIAVASNGQVLPQATINVAATAGFPMPGALFITTSSGSYTVNYTAAGSATTFTGCSGGTGTMSTGGAVNAGVCEAGSSTRFDDYTVVRIQTLDISGATLTGMHWTNNSVPQGLGPVKLLINYGTGPLTIAHNSGSSSAGNQFFLPTLANTVLKAGASMLFWHGANESYWIPIGQLPYTAGTGLALSTANAFSLSINAGTTQTCGANTFVNSLTGVGITGCGAALTGTTGTWVATSGANVTAATNPLTTGVLTAKRLVTGPAITPGALAAGTTNDWDATGLGSTTGVPLTSYVRAQTTGTAIAIVTGMVAPGAGVNPGFQERVCNFGPGPIQFLGNSSGSTAGNKFFMPNSVDGGTPNKATLTLPYGACGTFVYDQSGAWWPDGQLQLDQVASAGPVPALTVCGTSPTITGDAKSGLVTEGSIATGCTITFGQGGWDTNGGIPNCTVTSQAGLVFSYTVSRTAIVVTNVGALSSTKLNYTCFQSPAP